MYFITYICVQPHRHKWHLYSLRAPLSTLKTQKKTLLAWTIWNCPYSTPSDLLEQWVHMVKPIMDMDGAGPANTFSSSQTRGLHLKRPSNVTALVSLYNNLARYFSRKENEGSEKLSNIPKAMRLFRSLVAKSATPDLPGGLCPSFQTPGNPQLTSEP